MPGAGSFTMLGIFLIIMAIVVITVGRLLAGVIRDVNRHDAGLSPTSTRRRK